MKRTVSFPQTRPKPNLQKVEGLHIAKIYLAPLRYFKMVQCYISKERACLSLAFGEIKVGVMNYFVDLVAIVTLFWAQNRNLEFYSFFGATAP